MKLALDVMEGDHAPQAAVQGALQSLAATEPDFENILVGNKGVRRSALGVNGVCIVSHGSSSAKAIKNSILAAVKCVQHNLVDDIRKGLADHNLAKA